MTNLNRCYNIFDLREAAQRRLLLLERKQPNGGK